MNPNWLSVILYWSLWLAVDGRVLRVDTCNSFELLFAASSWFFFEFKVKVKTIYVGKICPRFNQLIILELGNNGGTLIKPIELLGRFSESMKSFSTPMEKAWPSMTLSEYPCSAFSGLIRSSSGANFGVHKSPKDRTLFRYSLWWDLQVY